MDSLSVDRPQTDHKRVFDRPPGIVVIRWDQYDRGLVRLLHPHARSPGGAVALPVGAAGDGIPTIRSQRNGGVSDRDHRDRVDMIG